MYLTHAASYLKLPFRSRQINLLDAYENPIHSSKTGQIVKFRLPSDVYIQVSIPLIPNHQEVFIVYNKIQASDLSDTSISHFSSFFKCEMKPAS